MKKPQWITIIAATCLLAIIFFFGRTIPSKAPVSVSDQGQTMTNPAISTDSILASARKRISPDQSMRLNALENSVKRGDVKAQQLKVLHDLAHFWSDSAAVFEPFAWYTGEAARLENSEKSLNFAARLFLDNLQTDNEETRRQWKALQAKDLFERSLKLNPEADSAKVGLGACFLFGGISATPMEGILKIREVAERDSSNVYAQMMLAKGSLVSGQYDKAINRLQIVNRLEPDNIEAILILADTYERTSDKASAIIWYQKSLHLVKRADAKAEIEQRIADLKK